MRYDIIVIGAGASGLTVTHTNDPPPLLQTQRKKMKLKKWIPLIIIVIATAIFYLFDLYKYFTFTSIKTYRGTIQMQIQTHPFLMPLMFILIYTAATALSFPGAVFLTLFGGFFFGLIGAAYSSIGATIGATLLFLAARTALGDLLKKRVSPFLEKIQKGFKRNASSYLLFLRFIPLFPFWLVNLAPAFLGVSLSTYIWTTCIGILPGCYVYTHAGHALGAIFENGETFSLDTIFNLQVKIALTLLALFSLIPILIKFFIRKWRRVHNAD